MSPKEMKDKVRYYLTEIWCNHNLDVLDEVLHPDFVAHSNPPAVGIEAVKQAWKTGVLEALSEKKVEFPHQLDSLDGRIRSGDLDGLLLTPVNFGNIFSLAGRIFATRKVTDPF
ncbi:MAG: hypothetical protein R3293_28985 [Candidatus Promineifilaceae bacterium]|nr:hypothetical protein [Candidatus Promineifilaceae bacterium]